MKQIIYYDIAFNQSIGHWNNIADHLRENFLENGYDFLHVTDPKICINKMLDYSLKTYSNIIFFCYFVPSITLISKIFELSKTYISIHFFINYLPIDEQNLVKDLEILRNCLNGSTKKNFYLLADNDNLYTYISKYFSKIETKLISPLILPTLKNNMSYQDNSKTKFNILFIYNKQTNAKFIEKVIHHTMTNSNNHLTIKVRPDLKLDLEYLKNSMTHNRITIINTFTSKSRYYEILMESDLIIINYNEPYFYRSSGMLLEAIYFKKILMVPSGSWLDKTLKKFGSGKSFLKNNTEDFILKYDQIMQNFSGYSKLSHLKYDEFMNHFDPQKIIKEIILSTTTSKVDTSVKYDLIIFYIPSTKYIYDNVVIQKIYDKLKKLTNDSKFVLCTFDKTKTLKHKIDNDLYFLETINLDKYENIFIFPYNPTPYEKNFLSDINSLVLEKYNKKIHIIDKNKPLIDSHLKIKPIIRSAHILVLCDYIDYDQLEIIKQVDRSKQLDICYLGNISIRNKKFHEQFNQVSPKINFANYNIIILLVDSPEFLAEAMANSLVILTDYNFNISKIVRRFQIGRAFNKDNIFFAFRNILKKFKFYKESYTKKIDLIESYMSTWQLSSFINTVIEIPIYITNANH